MMKKYLLTVLLVFGVSSLCFADWYVLNGTTNRGVAKLKYSPSQQDLDSRNEFAFFSNKEIALEDVEFFNNDIRARVKTQSEISEKEAIDEEKAEMATIYHIMYEMAYKEAIKRGHTFKRMGTHVDNIGVVTEVANEEKLVEEEVIKERVKELKQKGENFKHLK